MPKMMPMHKKAMELQTKVMPMKEMPKDMPTMKISKKKGKK